MARSNSTRAQRAHSLSRSERRKALLAVEKMANEQADNFARSLFSMIVTILAKEVGNTTLRTTERIWREALTAQIRDLPVEVRS